MGGLIDFLPWAYVIVSIIVIGLVQQDYDRRHK
jgi:hypothetical protein